jgi:peptidoglycan/xylan/chitin deacetylase (PgdA/CDA1 family)
MTGTFALTFDTELIWGSFDHLSPGQFASRYRDERGVIDTVLRLLDQFEIAATWAIVGHLFLSACQRDRFGAAHPELAVRPRQSWRSGDWYDADPCTDRRRDPLWYGDDIVDALQATRTPQEIGCHSFSHALFGDLAMTREAVDADLEACTTLAAARGIELRSFVFPRNFEGHHEALQAHGFRAYRGANPSWHLGFNGPLGRATRLIDQLAALPPAVSQPRETIPGLWNIPASAVLISHRGLRRAVTAASVISKVRTGLRRARETGGVFHLWTHPFNLTIDRRIMIALLETILQEAAEARDRGEIVIEPMGAIADRASEEASIDKPRSAPAATTKPSAQEDSWFS